MAELAHVTLIVLGYADWSLLLTRTPDIVSAFVATGILVAIGVLAIRAVRRVLPYAAWYLLHLSTYLILLLSYAHQFAAGQELSGHFGRWYRIGLYLFVIGCLAWGRVLAPLTLNVRHRLRVTEVVPEAPTWCPSTSAGGGCPSCGRGPASTSAGGS